MKPENDGRPPVPSAKLPTLEVMVATIRPDGIRRVAAMSLPKAEGLSWLVSWQMPGDEPIPESLASRADVRVLRHESRGLARNRNEALKAATADILLIADDDLVYEASSLQALRKLFAEHPETDLIAGTYGGADRKTYPAEPTEITLPLPVKGWYITECELAFRREKVQGRIGFDEEFGLGSAKFGAGEGDIFLTRAIRSLNLKGWFHPLRIMVHEAPTTGMRHKGDPRVIRAKGVFLWLWHPWTSLPRAFLESLRIRSQTGRGVLANFIDLLQGIRYAACRLRLDGTRRK